MAYDGKLLQRGMRCLIDNLGIIDAEKFIALFTQEQIPDYTQWQRDYFDSMTAEEFHTSLQEFMRNHPDDKHFCEGESTNEV
ncbi:MAG: hypothetical protein IJ774_02585 [Selenomonadaceae bacterium]|nr:hypothetical protein [Selenomonadaceae bacterium]